MNDDEYLDWSLVEAIDDALELLARVRADVLAGEPLDLGNDLPET